ncbi:putative membrane protein [Bacilli bacterium PM5-3]|nr:putative membrane protein [Bacilli bacterium PM5-3]
MNNKEQFLSQLEKLLIEKNVENVYSILREYSNKIDDLKENNYSFEKIIDELGNPSEIIKNYVDEPKKFDNDDKVYEKNDRQQFKKPQFQSNSKEKNKEIFENETNNEHNNENNQFDNRFKTTKINPNLVKNILYFIIGLMILSLIVRVIAFFFIGDIFIGESFFRHGFGYNGFFSSITTLLIIVIVIYILSKNNNSK